MPVADGEAHELLILMPHLTVNPMLSCDPGMDLCFETRESAAVCFPKVVSVTLFFLVLNVNLPIGDFNRVDALS